MIQILWLSSNIYDIAAF